METIFHTLPPVYNRHSRVLILGSMPSPQSRQVGFYYGHPQNRFWRVLAAVFGSPLPTTTEEKRAFLLERKIALWDVLARCDIVGASDSSIRNPLPNDFSPIFEVARIEQVYTTGAAATKLYTKLSAFSSSHPPIYLPSPSPANCRMPFEELAQAYQVILQHL
ncbi:DNA-deoxyinosine glycosylase [Clostridiaceae bacterium NSJ-31]|uniref:DNA-deoxyinosine glycosylase n=1 Tax=Ligaoa zhengdingensis TaxID=2763658 RepID=A0A926DY56_9FIRM|nr:DNA-deoxyinosine glycosylase [Ligaoa zhengdingensis]MBC8545355.1 DNA-deoxyinosine glycosylase [Ligaoa zhengdingensis]